MKLLELALSQNLPDIKTEDFGGKKFMVPTFSRYPVKPYPYGLLQQQQQQQHSLFSQASWGRLMVYSSFNKKKYMF